MKERKRSPLDDLAGKATIGVEQASERLGMNPWHSRSSGMHTVMQGMQAQASRAITGMLDGARPVPGENPQGPQP
jgi:hypothetical protein